MQIFPKSYFQNRQKFLFTILYYIAILILSMESNDQSTEKSHLELLKKHDRQIQILKSSTQPKNKLSMMFNVNDPQLQYRGSFNKYQQKQRQPELKQTVSTGYSIRDSIKPKSCRQKLLESKEMKKQDFVFGKLLGKGKFGQVYLAKHKKSGFVCAMKVLNKAKIMQENILHQLIRQIKIQSYCDHPNLIKLYSCFSSLDQIFLVTQLCTEGQLYKLIQKYKQNSKNDEVVPEKTISVLLKQLCEGIRYLHTLRIIHRDLKPENILIERGLVKICDFGWAVVQQNNLRSTFCGTPLYVSPEVLKGNNYDDKVDLWSLGIMAWQMKYGEIPFQINCQQQLIKIITDDIVFPSDIQISQEFKDFLEKILKKNPKQRLKIGTLLEHTFLNS